MFRRHDNNSSFMGLVSAASALNKMSLFFKVNDNLNNYHKFLRGTLEFISCVNSKISKTETLKHMCEVVPIETLKTLTDDIRSILIELGNLKRIFKDTRFHDMAVAILTEHAHLARMHDRILDNLIIKIGEKIESNLLTIGQEQARIKGKHDGLNRLPQSSFEQEAKIVRVQKKELMNILVKTKDEVDKGFEIIRKC